MFKQAIHWQFYRKKEKYKGNFIIINIKKDDMMYVVLLKIGKSRILHVTWKFLETS